MLIAASQMEAKVLRSAYSCFPTGVAAVCALRHDKPVGLVVSSLTSVSLNPALLSFCVQKTSTTWPLLRAAPLLGISVLAAQQAAVSRQLAGPAAKRFDGIEWEAPDYGALFVTGAVAWFECSIYQVLPAGDHEMAVAWIERLHADNEQPPLVFHASRYKCLLSG